MDLFVNAAYPKATVCIEGPILEAVDGKLRVRDVDIEYGGMAVARPIGDGTIAPYRADGTLELDRLA